MTNSDLSRNLEISLELPTEEDTNAVGAALAATLPKNAQSALLVELHGDLGMGKTALVRATLRAFGVQGAVRSPTYTLCEPYEPQLDDGTVLRAMHMDLYRLTDPEELEYLGLRELDEPGNLLLVEWPENGRGMLPKAALELRFTDREQGNGRRLVLKAVSDAGEQWLQALVVAGYFSNYM